MSVDDEMVDLYADDDGGQPLSPDATVAASQTSLAVTKARPVDVVSPIGMPSPAEWAQLESMAAVLSRSGLVPAALRRKPDDIMLVLLTGRDLRLAPTTALSKIHVIEGKPTCSAELMSALVNRRPGMSLWPGSDNDAEKATAFGSRDGREMQFTFRLEDAKRAGLAGKGTWAKWPQFMLWARAVSGLCRMAFADVLAGVSYTPEEMGAEVNEDGEVIDVAGRTVEPPSLAPGWPERALGVALDRGLTDDEVAEMVDTGTDGRTDSLWDVTAEDVPAIKAAMEHIVARKAPSDPGRPFDPAEEPTT